MYKIECYIPESHIDVVKQAIFDAGAGQIGSYHECCWQTLGQGQFRPQKNSQPFLGVSGKLEKVSEYKIEFVCKDSLINQVVEALKAAHPYETPAYFITRGLDL